MTRQQQKVQVIDPFQLSNWQDAILPDDFNIKFDLFLDKFRQHALSLKQHIRPTVSDVEAEKE